MSATFSKSLLSFICKPYPTIASVVQLFANHLDAEHYLLIERTITDSSCFLISSDILDVHIPVDDIAFDFDCPQVSTHDSPICYAGVNNVNCVFSVPVDYDLLIVLINPKSIAPGADVLSSTQSALRYVRRICPYDIDFTLCTVRRYTTNELLSFSIAKSHPSQLFFYVCGYFIQTGICERVGADPRTLVQFLLSIRSHYNDVPYHNWFHAIDVTLFVYTLHVTAHLERFLTDLEIFALFLAAICHDVDHNGLNNNFHRNAKTQFANLAPNLPPLEHRHSCISYNLLRPLLSSLPTSDRTIVVQFVIDCIMATDMEQHKKFVECWSGVRSEFNPMNQSHRLLLAQIIIKAADLSNVMQDFVKAEQLSKTLIAETQRQGRLEIAMGLPISPMCNPNDDTPLCVGQVGFYAFVAGPLMNGLYAFFPELKERLVQFEKNLQRWTAMKETWEAAKQSGVQ
jgi:hypothetical protein